MQCVRQGPPRFLRSGPDPKAPYFRGPLPVYSRPLDAARHSPFTGYCHSPGLVACANGDLLAVA
jgi:hypothetical protein